VGRFKSLFHFCESVDMRAANKQVLEALIKAGAFDRLGGNRHQMMNGLEKAMEIGSSFHSDQAKGQMTFFGQIAAEVDYTEDHKRLPDVAPWPEAQMLAYEKEVLGFYVTSNPLSHHAEEIRNYSSTDTARIAQAGGGEIQVVIGGMVTRIRYNITKNGRNAGAKMAVFVLEDLQGSAEVVLFPDALAQFGGYLLEDTVVFVKGKTDFRRERPNIIASEIIPLERAREKLAKGVWVRLDAAEVTAAKVTQIKEICQHHKGNRSLMVVVRTDKGKVYATADKSLSVNPDVEFCRKMKQLIGEQNLILSK
jgi:DNA polymerase-3 subunit alpha